MDFISVGVQEKKMGEKIVVEGKVNCLDICVTVHHFLTTM